MKISKVDDASIQAVQQYQRSEKVQSGSDKAAGANEAPREKVNLSAAARDIQKLRSVIAELPDIREEKVQDLKSRIETGNYNVSGEQIAEKMVSESLIDIIG